ncbi:uncharacterized protein [Choristoneura fumiferana]|uniref:uncharacterized protein n=1 Tax=Choristoneura fumiferana TaxID=7141 RepID=UPI003D15D990
MMCHKFLFLVVNLWVVRGSIDVVEFKDTMDSVPPLFGLDDWTRCQRPDDVYCVVEAALVSGNNSTMQLIKEYSSYTLQHYNRSLVHRGVCASRCAGAGWQARAQACVNDSVRAYGFEVRHLVSY